MKRMKAAIQNEPALLVGVVQAAFALAVAFGVRLSGEQTGAILGILSAVLALVVRSKVEPVKRARARRAAAPSQAAPRAA